MFGFHFPISDGLPQNFVFEEYDAPLLEDKDLYICKARDEVPP